MRGQGASFNEGGERTLCTRRCISAVLALIFLGCGISTGYGQEQEHAHESLGTVEFPISCSEPAQVEFRRGVALLHHMTYPRAREAFQQVANIDPKCAMAHWGIAMTLFQPLWPTRPTPAELQRGWEALQAAGTLGSPTERERLWLDAGEAFFHEPASADYWLRIRRWERAMERVYAAFPQDPEVAAFYALAHLATAPTDTVSQSHSERAASLLLAVYERNPDHPGAMHYLVHANDVPGREHESLEVVRKYEMVAPRNPHALHMPTNIYTRLGDWEAVTHGNLNAAEAALQSPAGDSGQFVWDEFPHAIEYLIYAYLQTGADEEAAAQLTRLRGTARLQPSFKTAFHLASTGARYAVERHAWSEAMSLAPRDPPTLDWDRFTWPEAVTWFARGLGAAREGRLEETRTAIERLGELERTASGAGEGLFARNIRILGLEVSAWLAQVERDRQSSVALMREAAELEVVTPKHAVTPAPILPGYELLGDLLLEQADPAEALMAYRRSLELYPRRFNSLLGAARAARAASDDAAARTFYQELLDLAAVGTRRSAIDEARTFVRMQR
jgi:tetratricopeptide (TPR) repeat protein